MLVCIHADRTVTNENMSAMCLCICDLHEHAEIFIKCEFFACEIKLRCAQMLNSSFFPPAWCFSICCVFLLSVYQKSVGFFNCPSHYTRICTRSQYSQIADMFQFWTEYEEKLDLQEFQTGNKHRLLCWIHSVGGILNISSHIFGVNVIYGDQFITRHFQPILKSIIAHFTTTHQSKVQWVLTMKNVQ